MKSPAPQANTGVKPLWKSSWSTVKTEGSLEKDITKTGLNASSLFLYPKEMLCKDAISAEEGQFSNGF